MPVKAQFKNRAKLTRQLQALDPGIEGEVAAAQRAAGDMLAEKIQARTPFLTGQLMVSTEAKLLSEVSPSQRARNVIASQTKDKNAIGIVADFYWRFIEYGTTNPSRPARPYVFPTYRASRKQIRRMISAAINKGVKRAAKKA